MFTRLSVSTALSLISLTATAIACVAPSCLASHRQGSSIHSTQGQPRRKVPRKFDQYGDVGECDETARLDNFLNQLQNEPTSKGYIIVYDGKNTLPGRVGGRLQRAMNYLTYQRGLMPDRVVPIKGGYRVETVTELWIAPEGAPAPEPSDTIVVKKETVKTFKYDVFYPENAIVEYREEPYPLEQSEIDAQLEATPLQQEEIVPTQQSSIVQPAQPPEGITGDLAEPYDDTLWGSKDYAQALGEKNVACVIYYLQREDGHLFKLEQIIEGGQNRLVNRYGIPADRIKIIFGGYRQFTTIDLWVVPPGAEQPIPTPDYEEADTSQEALEEVKE